MLDWQPTRTGPRAVIGATTITIHANRIISGDVYHFYAITVISATESRAYSSPMYYDTEADAQAGAERWVKKMEITQ